MFKPLIIFEVRPHPQRRGFDLNCARFLPYPLWYAKLYDAVIYAMQTGRDHRCEIRIFNHEGECLETVQTFPRESPAQSLPAFAA